MIIKEKIGSVLLLTLNSNNIHNPFSHELEDNIKEAVSYADDDDEIKSLVIYGGEGRSFSAGGDFNEVKELSSTESIENWIDRVIDLYESILKVKKPTVAAVDGHAIGIGFQFSLMFDYRIMSSNATYLMPELKHGIGCSVGAAILNFTHGYSFMQEIIYQCKKLSSEDCKKYGIVNQVVTQSELLSTAIKQAEVFGNYPTTSFISTKLNANKSFIDVLERTRIISKDVHRESFQARDSQKHFKKILKNKY